MVEIIGFGTEGDRRSIPLVTSSRRRIDNVQRQQRPPEAMQAAAQMFMREHKSLQTRSLSSVYNCVGLVFASRRTSVDIALLWMIFEDDGYRSIPESAVVPGDLVVYKDDAGRVTHVGIVIEHARDVLSATFVTKVVSQWGWDGEYIHDVKDVHYSLGSPREFWSERKIW